MNKDPLLRLKFMGYCMGCTPPDQEGVEFDDFVRWAKFQLATHKGYLMEDPIWDKYTDEQILVEYYAMTYTIDKQLRSEFEAVLKGVDQGDLDWIEDQIRKNKAEVEARKKEMDSIGDIEEVRAVDAEVSASMDEEDEEGFEFAPRTGVEE